ncbi:MarR family winged helix-turn-helix transcriptional regulator [Pseudonocardia sp. H11422]|uniref:MarR family winged helix-turn-helix transcriptional regulator n=1 Tax=Pseudonocardia sp. H11422 TaxID=2835866 RepID=UPI001BDCD44F|nr:MarR family transcriptional regulator [Pseudonocardia sp. H11422]
MRQAFAQRHGLHSTDLHALLAVIPAEYQGTPLTPGRLGERLSLSSGATTAVVDRLEHLGHVYRTREEADRRRVTVRFGGAAADLGSAFFGPLGERMDMMLAGWSDEDLDAVRRFLGSMNQLMEEHRHVVTDDVERPGLPPAPPVGRG